MWREWLATLLRDGNSAWPSERAGAAEELLARARQEGVVALAHARLSTPTCPQAAVDLFSRATREEAAQLLLREGECRRVLAALQAAGLQALLLKGSALAYWAYREPHLRECVDIDLLLRSRQQVDMAVVALHGLGYRLRERAVPGDLIGYELTCCRQASTGARVDVDLHWRLVNAPLYANRLQFDELWREARELPRLGPSAHGLAPVHALMHACMHRVLNLQFGTGDRLKWLYDLHLLATALDEAQWRQLQDLARERGLAGTCRHGLLSASATFSTGLPETVMAALAEMARAETLDVSQAHRWLYMQRANCCSLPTLGLRLRWLRQRLLPDADYLRDRYGGQHRSLPAIVISRLRDGLRRLGFK